MDQVQIPVIVSDFINTVAERWGYYFGKRAVQSDLMKATIIERKQVRAVNQSITSKLNEYLDKGTDVRKDVKALQGDLATARETLSEKASPYHAKKRPLIQAITYLDKIVIPNQLKKVTGNAVLPVFQVSETTLKAIAKPEK